MLAGRQGGLACMAGSLSVDLRRSVVGVIEGGLLSCRATAQRFSVSAPSTSRWRAQERREGISATPRRGGSWKWRLTLASLILRLQADGRLALLGGVEPDRRPRVGDTITPADDPLPEHKGAGPDRAGETRPPWRWPPRIARQAGPDRQGAHAVPRPAGSQRPMYQGPACRR
jgi:transposase-like protein